MMVKTIDFIYGSISELLSDSLIRLQIFKSRLWFDFLIEKILLNRSISWKILLMKFIGRRKFHWKCYDRLKEKRCPLKIRETNGSKRTIISFDVSNFLSFLNGETFSKTIFVRSRWRLVGHRFDFVFLFFGVSRQIGSTGQCHVRELIIQSFYRWHCRDQAFG